MTFPFSPQQTHTHYLLSASKTQASPVPLALQGTYASPTVSPKPVILSTALQTLLFLSQTLNPDFLFSLSQQHNSTSFSCQDCLPSFDAQFNLWLLTPWCSQLKGPPPMPARLPLMAPIPREGDPFTAPQAPDSPSKKDNSAGGRRCTWPA